MSISTNKYPELFKPAFRLNCNREDILKSVDLIPPSLSSP